MGIRPRSIVHYGMAGMKGAPAGVGSGWGLAERSQSGVKWFGVRGVETGDLRVRRPGRTRRAGRVRGRLWPGAFLRPGWHDRGRGGWHRGGTGVWRSSSGCRRRTVRGGTSRGRCTCPHSGIATLGFRRCRVSSACDRSKSSIGGCGVGITPLYHHCLSEPLQWIASIEEHLLWCPDCIGAAEESAQYVDTLRVAIIARNCDLE